MYGRLQRQIILVYESHSPPRGENYAFDSGPLGPFVADLPA